MTDSTQGFRITSLGKLRMKDAWRLELLHSQPLHRLYWITRGQGRATIRGVTRGYGPNTAMFLPAGTQMAMELPAQLQGIELALPADNELGLPQTPFQRRIATIEGQASLTGHLERAEREISTQAPAMNRALMGYGLLISAWVTRETGDDHGLALRERSHRLAEDFADAVEGRFRSGAGVADYAQALKVTPTHLSRVCRDASGRPALARPVRQAGGPGTCHRSPRTAHVPGRPRRRCQPPTARQVAPPSVEAITAPSPVIANRRCGLPGSTARWSR